MEALEKLIYQAELQKLQLQIQSRYLANMEVFKVQFPSIWEKFNNRTAKNYVVKLDSNNELNLYSQKHNTFFYSDSPLEYCRLQVELYRKSPHVKRMCIEEAEVINPEHIYVRYINKLVQKYQAEGEKHNYSISQRIYNLMMTSIGIGYQLPELMKQYHLINLFIFENDLDIFQASLYCIDWRPVLEHFSQAGRSITFCLGVEPQLALSQIEIAINRIGLHNHTFTHIFTHTKRKVEKEYLEYYLREMHSVTGGLGYFDDEQIGLAHTLINLQSKNAVFVHSPKNSSLKLPPILVVGNGPSLDQHKTFLAENKNRVIIISCGSAIGSLIKMGIKPDFHVETERTIGAQDMLEFGTNSDDRKGVSLIALNTVSPTLFDKFDSACFAKKPNDICETIIDSYYSPHKITNLPYCNPTVANCGLSVAIQMGFSNIHLVGVDFGVLTEGEHHSKSSPHYDIDNELDNESDSDRFQYNKTTFDIPGNFGGLVSSQRTLNMARMAMERLIYYTKSVHPNLQVINSNNGVFIDGATPTKLSGIHYPEISNKEKTLKSIKNNNFLKYKNKNFKTHLESLKYFFSIKKELKMSSDIDNEALFHKECDRIYSLISKENDNVTHILLRGSINIIFSCIIQHSYYLLHPKKQADYLNIGITIYNEFIDSIYDRMINDPLRIDDTHNEDILKIKSRSK